MRADELDPASFLREYVARARPLVIRGLAKDWCTKLGFSIELLRSQAAQATKPLLIWHKPFREARNILEVRETERLNATLPRTDYLAFVDELASAGRDGYVHGHSLACKGPLAFLADGNPVVERLLPGSRGPASRVYPAWRVFVSHNGYTDWHWHQSDETLTLQVHGSKELTFLGRDAQTFDALNRIEGLICDAPPSQLASLKLYRTVLEPGDAIYIPVYSWHAAEGSGLCVTTATTFRSPLHVMGDLRIPAARNLIRDWILPEASKWKYLPLVLGGAVYAELRRLVRPGVQMEADSDKPL